MPYTFTKLGLETLKRLEACELLAYYDKLAGVWSIGYGDTENVRPHMVITQEEATARLLKHVAGEEEVVKDIVGEGPEDPAAIRLTNNQYSALLIFVYNVGSTAFEDSILARYFAFAREGTAPNTSYVEGQLRRWNKARGKVVQGLINRREAEIALWNTPDTAISSS